MLKTLMIRSALIAFACAMSVAAHAYASDPKRFDVPAGDLTAALQAIAKQAGIELVYQSDQIKGLRTQGVFGTFTAEEAVTKLLEGTPLTFRKDPSGAMLIAPPKSSLSTSQSGSALPTSSGDARVAQATAPSPGTAEAGTATSSQAEPNNSSPGTGEEGGRGSGTVREERDVIDEVVVTGTHIRGASADSSPAIVYERAEIEGSGAATIDQFMRFVPQNLANVEGVSNFGLPGDAAAARNLTLGAAVNLRGLGPGSTLVLLNGRRMAPSGSSGDQVDISLIPLPAIERVEILTDGASSLYGADAVAGVVNYVLRKDFTGAQTAVRLGDTTQGGGQEKIATQTLGRAWQSGSIVAALEYLDQDPIFVRQRGFITPRPGFTGASTIGPSQERIGALISARQAIADRTELFADVLYADRDFQRTQDLGANFNDFRGSVGAMTGTLGVRQGIFGRWQANVSTTFSEVSSDGVSSSSSGSARAVELETRSVGAAAIADGPLWRIAGGDVRAALGAEWRREHFANTLVGGGSEIQSRTMSYFGEIVTPLIGSTNARRAAQRLELSLSGRYDDYNTFGSATTGKAGLFWAPSAQLGVRGTYGSSFRIPPLGQIHPLGTIHSVATVYVNPAGGTLAGVQRSGANPQLQPETAHSFTAGIEYNSPWLAGFNATVGYYSIDYEDRISTPPVRGSIFQALLQQATLAPFLNLSPTPEEVQAIYAGPNFFNLNPPVPASAIRLIVDNRFQNIGISKDEGIDFAVRQRFALAGGELGANISGQYALRHEFQTSALTPSVSLLDTVFQLPRLRARATADWTSGAVAAFAAVNYTGSYRNALVIPRTAVDSYATCDIGLRLRGSEDAGAFRGLSVSFNVLNAFDKDPPALLPPSNLHLGYDPANASYRGRSFSVSLTKDW